jgi:hypothetical protein
MLRCDETEDFVYLEDVVHVRWGIGRKGCGVAARLLRSNRDPRVRISDIVEDHHHDFSVKQFTLLCTLPESPVQYTRGLKSWRILLSVFEYLEWLGRRRVGWPGDR